MKKFKEYVDNLEIISEAAPIYTDLGRSDETLRKHRKIIAQTLKAKTQIYRGLDTTYVPSSDENSIFKFVVYGDSRKFSEIGGRPTLSNANRFMNSMMNDILPSWKEYPRRDQSFICATSREIASAYGEVFLVIPLPGATKIGVCSNTDIYYSFSNDAIYRLFGTAIPTMYPDFLERHGPDFLKRVGVNFVDNGTWIRSSDKIKDFLQTLSNELRKISMDELKELYDVSYTPNFLIILKQNIDSCNCSIIEYFDQIFNPEDNKFQLMEYEQILNSDMNYGNEDEREVWFSGPALFIRKSYLETLRIKLAQWDKFEEDGELNEASFHPSYKDWGWITPEGKLWSAVSTPEIKQFVDNTKNSYFGSKGIIHLDLLIRFNKEYEKKYKEILEKVKTAPKEDQRMEFMFLLNDDILEHAVEQGWARYYIDTDKTSGGNRLVLNISPQTNKLNLLRVLFSDNMVVSFDTILGDIIENNTRRSHKTFRSNGTRESLKAQLEKNL